MSAPRTIRCASCGEQAVVIDAPMLVRDRRTGVEHWVDADLAYCRCGAGTLVDLPLDAVPMPDADVPPGEAETEEGRAWLEMLRSTLRTGPGDRGTRLSVARAWHALTPGGRLDAAWALTREERAWLALACDELLGLR